MAGMLLAEAAVLAHFDTVRIVALILHGIVIALLTLCAGHRDLNTRASYCHSKHLLKREKYRHRLGLFAKHAYTL